MRRLRTKSRADIFLALVVVAMATFGSGNCVRGDQGDGKTQFLIVGKSRIADPPQLQQRAIDAVQKIAAAGSHVTQDKAMIEALAENVMTIPEYRGGSVQEKVNGAIFRDQLRQLAEKCTPHDTVVIYTHSHGYKGGFEASQPLGGIAIDLPVKQLAHSGALLWDEYTDLILEIPAKNVVVLTMSCFSGGFVEYLNSAPVRTRWQDRRRQSGRNLIIITSQNPQLVSESILKDGQVVNPFTYAITKAFEGQADGFELFNGLPAASENKDGQLSAGEIVDYISYTTEYATSESPRFQNTAKPQATGSFEREDILFQPIRAPK